MTLSNIEKHDRLRELMSHFDTAMLVTHTEGENLRSRPLAVVVDKTDPDKLYFSTALDSPKVLELEENPHVNVSMQDKRRFISITGVARVTSDRALIDRLWSEGWKVWFPQGKDDPELCLIIFEPIEATYWDASGMQGISYLFDMAKAYVSGERPSSDNDERHVGTVEFDT